jgi:hypothetical protein
VKEKPMNPMNIFAILLIVVGVLGRLCVNPARVARGAKKAYKRNNNNEELGGIRRMLSGVCTITHTDWLLTGRAHLVSRYRACARY